MSASLPGIDRRLSHVPHITTINVRQNHNYLYFALYSTQGQEEYKYKTSKTRGAEEQYQHCTLNVEPSTVLKETDALDAMTRRQQPRMVDLPYYGTEQ